MKRLKWLLLIFSAIMNTSISGGTSLQKSIFSWFPYLHKTLVAVKEQDVHISRKYTCVRATIMEGVKQQRHKKLKTKRKGTFLVFCFVLKSQKSQLLPQSDFWHLFIHYVIASKDDLQKISRGLVHWSHVIPVNGSTPPKLVCWVE